MARGMSGKDVDRLVGLTLGSTTRWMRNREKINKMAQDEHTKHLFNGSDVASKRARTPYILAHQRLYKLFKARRAAGRVVSRRWLRFKLRDSVRICYPEKAATFKGGYSTLQRWRKKYKVVPRRRTNKKRKKLAERIPRWQRYHWRQVKLRKMGPALANGEALQDATYGRWAPRYTFSLDQVPCPFAIGLGKTMETKGASFVHISQPADGLEKRQATLQLIFRPTDQEVIPAGCLEPDKTTKAFRRAVSQPKGCIIFRGKGMRLSALEKAMWDPRVIVLFQPKAWVDRPTAIKHVEALETWFKEEIPDSIREDFWLWTI